MNLLVLPNQVCLIVKLYNNRPELLPDSNDIVIQYAYSLFCVYGFQIYFPSLYTTYSLLKFRKCETPFKEG